MTDLVITAANVKAADSATKKSAKGGGTITPGKVIYKDLSTGKLDLVDADSATASQRDVEGIALSGGGVDQPIFYMTEGDLDVGAVLTVGKVYVASDTAGGIMPVEDLEAGDYVTILGVAKTTSILAVKINKSGVAVPA